MSQCLLYSRVKFELQFVVKVFPPVLFIVASIRGNAYSLTQFCDYQFHDYMSVK